MKTVLSIFLLLIPAVIFAQDFRGMNEADMQKMMQQMQEAQKCMQNIDQEKLKALEQRSYEFEAEIKSLCAEGKRDKAQKKAISFGKEFAKDPTMITMRKCNEKMKDVTSTMPLMSEDYEDSNQHVCDEEF